MLRQLAGILVPAVIWVMSAVATAAAPFAAMVVDARTGQILHAQNADTRLHPASLTKMMTLYIAFEAVRQGEITLDTMVTVSRKAASEPPSKLGLRAGQKIRLRYLIRAAAVRSANDAATAIGEALSGSEAAFARRMNRTAKALGMTRTTFRNANGLTETGHMSTARDMTILGRHLIYDYPQYYNLFSRRSADAGVAKVSNTNRKFLDGYAGADGIKTGYTSAAGFNLTASAERGDKRVVVTVFGGRTATARNAKVAELMDLGFGRAPANVAVQLPNRNGVGISVRNAAAPTKSVRPRPRGTPPEAMLVALAEAIARDLAEASAMPVQEESAPEQPRSAEIVPIPRPAPREGGTVVARASTNDKRLWAIHLGRFSNRTDAERLLLRTALQEMDTLDGALRKIVSRGGYFEANFVGLTQGAAMRACARIAARSAACVPVAPPT